MYTSKFTRPTNCWFDNECKFQKRIVNDALKIWKKDLTNSLLKEVFFKEKHLFKKLTKFKKREALETANFNLSILSMKNPKKFWKIMNLKKSKKKSICHNQLLFRN